jgi:hypothetical protein
MHDPDYFISVKSIGPDKRQKYNRDDLLSNVGGMAWSPDGRRMLGFNCYGTATVQV